MTVARTLADHVVRMDFDSIPTEHIDQLKRFVFDYLGIAVRGSQVDTGEIMRAFVSETGGVEQSSLIGQIGRFPAVNAAFANAVSEHSIELDDVDELALFHYGPPTISAALAVAEWTGASGREFLTALMAGCEVFSRVSRATNNDLRNRGFHTTPTAGVFAAAAAAGKLLGLDADGLTSAFGLAGAQASGTMEMYGPSMQKRFNPGPSARNGVTAAILAQKGFTGADTILEGERGFGVAFAGRFDVDAALEGLGSMIPVTIEHKPYSAARPIHNGVDCALAVRSTPGFDVDAVESIVIRRHPDWALYHLNAVPTTFHEAQVSLPYSVAVALVFGAALPDQYSDENLENPLVRRLSQLVEIEVDDSLARGVSCDMRVGFADGSSASSLVDYPKGSAENPMTRDDLRAKFDLLTAPYLPVGAAERIEKLVDDLENLHDVAALIESVQVVSTRTERVPVS